MFSRPPAAHKKFPLSNSFLALFLDFFSVGVSVMRRCSFGGTTCSAFRLAPGNNSKGQSSGSGLTQRPRKMNLTLVTVSEEAVARDVETMRLGLYKSALGPRATSALILTESWLSLHSGSCSPGYIQVSKYLDRLGLFTDITCETTVRSDNSVLPYTTPPAVTRRSVTASYWQHRTVSQATVEASGALLLVNWSWREPVSVIHLRHRITGGGRYVFQGW